MEQNVKRSKYYIYYRKNLRLRDLADLCYKTILNNSHR